MAYFVLSNTDNTIFDVCCVGFFSSTVVLGTFFIEKDADAFVEFLREQESKDSVWAKAIRETEEMALQLQKAARAARKEWELHK